VAVRSFAEFAHGSLPQGSARICVSAGDEVAAAVAAPERAFFRSAEPDYAAFAPETFDAVVIEGVSEPGANPIGLIGPLAVSIRPGGLLLLSGVAWDLLDFPTVDWFYHQRKRLAEEGRGPDVHATLVEFRLWLEEEAFAGVPAHHELRYALYERFEELAFEWAPALYRYLDGQASLIAEDRLIARHEIRPLGFHYLGRRRAEADIQPSDALVA
jgi:hypothetical protein